MAEMISYVALQPFSLSYQVKDKVETVNLKTGEELLFDGLYVEYNGERGQARSLCKVVGEWIAPVDGETPVASSPVSVGPSSRTYNATGGRQVEQSSPENDLAVRTQQESYNRNQNITPSRSNNATGGRQIEQSSPEVDLGVRQQQESANQEMARLLNVEIQPQKTQIVSDMRDIRKELNIIDDDTSVVAKVRQTETTGTKNTSGVQIDQKPEAKRPVVSQDGQMVKKTAYNTSVEEPSQRKRLVVDQDAQGVEVRKTSAAKVASQAKAAPKKMVVVREEDSVIETSYGKQKSTDVGSSTQSKVEADVIMSNKATPVKSPKIIRETVTEDAVVVGKVSKSRQNSLIAADNPTVTQGGITAKLTVGPEGTMDVGEVKFSSSDGGIEMGEVTFGEAKSKAVDVSDEATIIESDDIDVDDILGNL